MFVTGFKSHYLSHPENSQIVGSSWGKASCSWTPRHLASQSQESNQQPSSGKTTTLPPEPPHWLYSIVYPYLSPRAINTVPCEIPTLKDCLGTERKSYLARGEQNASRGAAKSMVPDSRTTHPGRNFRLFGLGVSWVWTNIVLAGEKGWQKVKGTSYSSNTFLTGNHCTATVCTYQGQLQRRSVAICPWLVLYMKSHEIRHCGVLDSQH